VKKKKEGGRKTDVWWLVSGCKGFRPYKDPNPDLERRLEELKRA